MDIKPGNVCRCQHGYLGVVTKKCTQGGVLYIGICFDGSPWSSKKPVKIAENINEYINSRYKLGDV